jgi:hypothetical protein
MTDVDDPIDSREASPILLGRPTRPSASTVSFGPFVPTSTPLERGRTRVRPSASGADMSESDIVTSHDSAPLPLSRPLPRMSRGAAMANLSLPLRRGPGSRSQSTTLTTPRVISGGVLADPPAQTSPSDASTTTRPSLMNLATAGRSGTDSGPSSAGITYVRPETCRVY